MKYVIPLLLHTYRVLKLSTIYLSTLVLMQVARAMKKPIRVLCVILSTRHLESVVELYKMENL